MEAMNVNAPRGTPPGTWAAAWGIALLAGLVAHSVQAAEPIADEIAALCTIVENGGFEAGDVPRTLLLHTRLAAQPRHGDATEWAAQWRRFAPLAPFSPRRL